MPFTSDGTEYFKTGEVAVMLGVAPATIRSLLHRGVLPEVPRYRVGTRVQRGFTQQWADEAKTILENRAAE